ncbi:MAG: phosphomannose isomerase type II C-terminal cupin domain [Nanoarchaeota archaeon]|nr:phosphomannose isomerase type II C-terminal cupin domain [Nanoarchaeota archaeon]MBU0978066.1 phosphomannose isomerase type II C-terminal cupin domain [Nanoarchaeota archaeon]
MKKRVDKKLWGWEDIFALNEVCSVKILNVKPGQKFSFQKHKRREEFWRVVEGGCRVWLGGKKIRAKAGDEFFIKKGQLHRIEALKDTAKVLEISFGKFDPKDIIRVEDDYGRV